jgi:hypothetical protein
MTIVAGTDLPNRFTLSDTCFVSCSTDALRARSGFVAGANNTVSTNVAEPLLWVSWKMKRDWDSTMIYWRGYDGDGGCSHAEARVRGQCGGRGAPICLTVTVARVPWCWLASECLLSDSRLTSAV